MFLVNEKKSVIQPFKLNFKWYFLLRWCVHLLLLCGLWVFSSHLDGLSHTCRWISSSPWGEAMQVTHYSAIPLLTGVGGGFKSPAAISPPPPPRKFLSLCRAGCSQSSWGGFIEVWIEGNIYALFCHNLLSIINFMDSKHLKIWSST